MDYSTESATFERELSLALDEITQLLDIAYSPCLVDILKVRKAGLERRVFAHFAHPEPTTRPDPET